MTWLLLQYGQPAEAGGCPWDGTRDADFSNNGTVWSEDYTFLVTYWHQYTTCACTTSPMLSDDSDRLYEPLDVQVVVRSAQLPVELASAVDLNADGLVDYHDVWLFEEREGLPHELSDAIQATAEQGAGYRNTQGIRLPRP